MLSRAAEAPIPFCRKASIPPGQRIYAIGDVHGRLDLLERLIAAIRMDNDRRAPAEVKLLLLGDIVDRGPDSAAVVHYCRKYAGLSDRFVLLKGNHEAAMVAALRGGQRTLAAWLPMGGDITLQSWGVDPYLINAGASKQLIRAAQQAVTVEVIDWMAKLPLMFRSGDYLFVHAGIRPGVKLSRQRHEDLLWIGEHFLESDVDHAMIVVHGHSIDADGPVFRPNRIGIDTGAYHTDRLTGLRLESDEVSVLTSADDR